jgi:hypothetical protein
MTEAEKARLRADLRRRQSMQQFDSMGLPQAPAGGSAVNPQAVSELRDKSRAMATGAANGASFGFGDNIAAGIGGVDSMVRGQGFRRGYDNTLDIVREGMASDQQQNPMAYGAGEIAGAVAPAALAAPLATGSRGLMTAARGAGIGAVEGGLQGAGNADGQDVATSALSGGLTGAFIGGAAPVAVGAAGRVKNAIKDPVTGVIDSLTNRANTGKANRAISDMLRASKQTPNDVSAAVSRAAMEGQPEFRMMDAMGVSGRRQASGVARLGGDPGAELADYLATRQAGQSERVAGFVDEGFGLNGTTAAKETGRLTSARSTAADSAYDAARGNAAPVDVRGALGVIDARIGGMDGSGVAGDGIDGLLSKYRGRLAAQPGPDGVMRELSDFDRVLGVKQSIQDDIGTATRAGRNNEARELGKLLTELDGALESSSDMYRTANDGFRDASRVIDAVDEGAAMSRPSQRAGDTTSKFASMNPDQQQAARTGYGDSLLSRIEANTSPTSNNAKLLQSPKRDAEASAMVLDPELYGRRLSRENDMWQTQNRAVGGSMTADNMADQAATDGVAGGILGALRNSHGMIDGAVKVADALTPLARGQNEATRQLIARALMSKDPQSVLAPILRQEMTGKSNRRVIEAMLRQPAQEASRQ